MRRIVIIAALMFAAGPAFAHHGTIQYDFDREVSLTGRVKTYTYGNPHIWLTLDVDRPGGTQAWSLEGPPPLYASQRGWAAGSLKAGQKVVVAMAPLRDGSAGGIILTVKDLDGKLLLERGRRY